MTDTTPSTWRSIFRVVLKAALLFILLNLLFALASPVEALGRLSLYNWLVPGRERLPYSGDAEGATPAGDSNRSYSLSTDNIPAMLASHIVARPKAADEYRVLLIGDSSAWGWLLKPSDTLAAQLNAMGLKRADGRRVVVYNLGYPIMSLTKDLLLLDEAMQDAPDAVLWPMSLASFPRDKQLYPPLVQANANRVRRLALSYGLDIDPADPRFVNPSFLDQTLVGQRRALADWLRLQLYGFAWGATGIDQDIPATYKPRATDLKKDESWETFTAPADLTPKDLAFDVLAAGVKRAGNIPVLLVNEPMFISSGQNSDLRYNAFYPRWAYDQYRALLQAQAAANGWRYLDLWDSIPPDEFTDSPVHMTPAGTRLLAERLRTELAGNP
jgi:hypothetical protein